MLLPKVRPAIAKDAKQMGALHVTASRRVYTGLVPDRALGAITPAERARRWAESLASARPDDGIFVSEANARILGLGHCAPQRTRTLSFPGEFFCLYVDPDTQRRGVGTALMIVMARFLIGHGMSAASLWVARDNFAARRFYDRLGGTIFAEKQEEHGDFVLAEVAYGWPDVHHFGSAGMRGLARKGIPSSRLSRTNDDISGAVHDLIDNVRYWHKADIPTRSINVRYWG
jgi:ribosomal protein S18 acetylase RimI-like enzyme